MAYTTSFSLTRLLLLLLLTIEAAPSQMAITIQVDLAKTLVTLKDRPFGIDANYLTDDDHLRPGSRPLAEAINEMGAGWIRYPGGEKSDWQLWSQPPYDKPKPLVYGYYKGYLSDPLDFDEYMALVKATGAQPFVVVGYDSQRTGISKATYLTNAVEWVRYANITKKYHVQHWEIGNENWNNNTGTPQAVAKDVAEISRAMKAVDPTIKTGASGNGDSWWNAYLAADPNIDFFSVSNYTGTHGGYYEYAGSDTRNLLGGAGSAMSAMDRLVPVSARAGKSVIISEFNSKDWSGGWGDGNDLGHALMNFETIGQILMEPRLTTGMMWTTRWMDWKNPSNLFYALDAKNGVLPQGRALAIWGQNIQSRMVSVGNASGLITFASASAIGDIVNIFLLNKRSQAKTVDITALNAPDYASAEISRYQGKADTDVNPTWSKLPMRIPVANTIGGLELPGLSITVISMRTSSLAIRPIQAWQGDARDWGHLGRLFNVEGRQIREGGFGSIR